jgi:hypothetical protein
MSRRATATDVVVVTLLILSPVGHAVASNASFTLKGSLTITDHGQAVPLTTVTCQEIGALAGRRRVVVRSKTSSRTGKLIYTPPSQPADALGPCRLSFRIQDMPSGSSYSLTVAGRKAGTWTRLALQRRHWWLFFNAQGDSDPATWHLSEVSQVNTGDITVPDVSTPAGVKLDPTVWREEWTTTPGTDRRACTSVGKRTVLRSGSFIVGNFNAYRTAWNGTLERSKLYYVPLHPEGRPPLMVSAQSLDNPREVVPVLNGFNEAWGATGDFFYATGTVLPHRGRWRLTATAGQNWGCFDFEL